jgi:alkaline phosphatase
VKHLGSSLIAAVCLICLLSGCFDRDSALFDSGSEPIEPFNIILIIGDGMGENHRRAASWLVAGEDAALEMDLMPVSARMGTASAYSPITDSAAAATALACGVKTRNGVIGLDRDLNRRTSILERAQRMGKAVGLVTTTQISHATPAAFIAKVESRHDMTDIAAQMMDADIDVLLGGGENEFLPSGSSGFHSRYGGRSDGRDLIAEARSKGYSTVFDEYSFRLEDPTFDGRLLGLFAEGGMMRPYSPSLAAMVKRAISILSRDPDGFFLMVEGGQIDWASHYNSAEDAIGETIGLDEAVTIAKSFAALQGNTMVIVLADHETGGMSLNLLPTGNAGEDGPFFMPGGEPFYVNWGGSGHTPKNVPLTAGGPGAKAFPALLENTQVHDIMLEALLSRSLVNR